MFKRIAAWWAYNFKIVEQEFSYGGGLFEYTQRDLDRRAARQERERAEREVRDAVNRANGRP